MTRSTARALHAAPIETWPPASRATPAAARRTSRAAPAARPDWPWPRALERVLTDVAGARARPRLRPAVAAAARRETWRQEQVVDWGFNVALAAGLVAIVAGLGGPGVAGRRRRPDRRRRRGWLADAAERAAGRGCARQATVMAMATLLLATTLGAWWWAEERGALVTSRAVTPAPRRGRS